MVVQFNTNERAAANAYLASHLGGTLFHDVVARQLSDADAAVYLVLSSLPKSLDFASGMGCSEENSRIWLVEEMARFVREGKFAVCLIEDFCADAADTLALEGQLVRVGFHEGHAVWILDRDVATNEAMASAFSSCAVGRPLMIAFVEASENFVGRLDRESLSEAEVALLKGSVRRIVTDAFDEEGYLVWERLHSAG